MDIVVQKFGGTSIRNMEGFKKALVHIRKELENNHKVVCVVSAMGRMGEPYSADTLKNLINNYVTKKEQDKLLSVGEIISSVVFTDFLIKNEIKAISLSSKEVGLITDDNFTNANIIDIDEEAIKDYIKQYDVVVVPGFQGITRNGDISTLGRGGSDTTAISLGIKLNALYVEIVSDVEGVYTADPRKVKNAVKFEKLNYDVLLDITKHGSRVLHYKGAILAKDSKIKLRFTSIDDKDCFTEVVDEKMNITNMTYKDDYILYDVNADHFKDFKIWNLSSQFYVEKENEKEIDAFLKSEGIAYDKYPDYSKIIVIRYEPERTEQSYFVETKYLEQKMNEIHNKIFKMG